MKLCGNCVFPQNFHTKKLGEITVFYAVKLYGNCAFQQNFHTKKLDEILVFYAVLHRCFISLCLFNVTMFSVTLKNFAEITGKHLRQTFFKQSRILAKNFVKTENPLQMFSFELLKFFQNGYFIGHHQVIACKTSASDDNVRVKSVQIRNFFWSVFSRIWTEYGEILLISPYSVRMRENTDQKKLRIWKLFT